MITVVLPAYNEEKFIRKTTEIIENLMEKKEKYEIIVADDGSTDRTKEIIKGMMKKHKNVRMVSNPINMGRGAALTRAFKAARGDIVVYIDVDLAIGEKYILDVVKAIREGADIAIGSKHIKGAEVAYPKLRRFLSKGYALLARLFLGSRIRDYQCGLKGFKREVALRLLPKIKRKGWLWDTEILVKAGWEGYKIKELPVKVVNVYGRESKVKVLKDTIYMGKGLLRLFYERLKR